MAAEVVAIASPLVPCMPDWAPEKTMYLRVFDPADAERIFADEFPQFQNLVAQFKSLPPGMPAIILFSAPGGEPIRLYSGELGIFPAINDCADLGHVLAAVWWPGGA
jgi:hypothetical protein